MKKQYVIVGDNNFWYSTFEASTQDEIDSQVKFIRESIGEGSDMNLPEATKLFVYEATLIKTEKL
jgi:hypothetical protein